MPPETLAVSDTTLAFTSQVEEMADADLAVAGELPEWLAGTLVRVTPGLLDPGGIPVRHWFDGLAVLHAFTIGPEKVGYASRPLESRDYRNVREHGKTGSLGFATDPCRSIFRRVTSLFDPNQTDNCNVNVTRLGERWLAMTETPLAIEFDPSTLATLGHVDWAGRLDAGTAHPHYDFERGETVSYSVRFGPVSSYRLHAAADGSERREVARVPVREPSYMHSFGLTARYAILFESPLVANPLKLAFGNRSFIESYRWKPERGSNFVVIDRETGNLVRRVPAEPFFTFHQVNAFEDGGELVVDLVGFDDASIIDDLFLDRLRAGTWPTATGNLRRYRLPLEGGAARREDLATEPFELPRIAYRTRNGKPYRYVYGVGQRGDEYLDRVVKVDVESGAATAWGQPGSFPGEPVFVARPGGEAEDDGVLLSVVLDTLAGRSFLAVLDARDLTEIARADAPHHIPFGFHGDFGRDHV